MPRVVKAGRVAALLLLAGTVLVQPAAGQSGENLPVLTAVLRYRLYWMEDRTPFDPCSLYAQGGTPSNFPGDIPAELRPLVGALESGTVPASCADAAAAARALPERVVRVYSVAVRDSVAHVRLHVRKGERAHTEDFTVKRALLGGWDVTEMRMWGRMDVVSPRRAANDQ